MVALTATFPLVPSQSTRSLGFVSREVDVMVTSAIIPPGGGLIINNGLGK